MKQKLLSYCLLFLVTISANRLKAQSYNQASVPGHVFAEIVAAFSAIETSQMNFGRFSPGSYGGEIILTPQGTISVLGSVAKSGGLHNAASFFLSGAIYTAFSVSLPKTSTVLTNNADAKTLRVKNWVSVPSPGASAGTLQNGAQTVYVGATLEVGTLNDNPVGIYTGSYTITFDFN
jgi:hypothetical protein